MVDLTLLCDPRAQSNLLTYILAPDQILLAYVYTAYLWNRLKFLILNGGCALNFWLVYDRDFGVVLREEDYVLVLFWGWLSWLCPVAPFALLIRFTDSLNEPLRFFFNLIPYCFIKIKQYGYFFEVSLNVLIKLLQNYYSQDRYTNFSLKG